jgi:hypothetical protein
MDRLPELCHKDVCQPMTKTISARSKRSRHKSQKDRRSNADTSTSNRGMSSGKSASLQGVSSPTALSQLNVKVMLAIASQGMCGLKEIMLTNRLWAIRQLLHKWK